MSTVLPGNDVQRNLLQPILPIRNKIKSAKQTKAHIIPESAEITGTICTINIVVGEFVEKKEETRLFATVHKCSVGQRCMPIL